MTILVALLSTGKGTWGHVSQLIKQEEWEKIVLITNDFGKEKYTNEKAFEAIVIDMNKTIPEMKKNIKDALKGKIPETEVALNIVSGSGNEHTALLAALLELGLGIRLVIAGKEKMEIV
jgi:hypothetical protein